MTLKELFMKVKFEDVEKYWFYSNWGWNEYKKSCSKSRRYVFNLLREMNIEEDDDEIIRVCHRKSVGDSDEFTEENHPLLAAITSFKSEPCSITEIPFPVILAKNIQVDEDVSLSLEALAAFLFDEITSTEFEIL